MPGGLSGSLLSQLGSGVRRAYPIITYQGVDISSVVTPSLISLTYKESYKDDVMSDTVDVELADPEGLFRLTYTLTSDQMITVSLVVENWNGPGSGKITKPCGTMYVTSVQMHADKSKGTTIKLMCSSIAASTSMRLEKKSHAWAQTTVQDVAAQIAADNNWKPQYLPSTNPSMDRVDQHDHSDAYMLKKICSENDFCYKIVNGTLVIISNEDSEAQAAIGTIICPSKLSVGGLNGSGIESWEYRENTEDCSYASCIASIKDNVTGKTTTQSTSDPKNPNSSPILHHHSNVHPPAGQSYMYQGQVQSISPTVPSTHTQLPAKATAPEPLEDDEDDPNVVQKAKTVSKAKLKQKNRKANEFVISMPLNLAFEARTIYSLSGFTPDANEDTWIVSDVQHSFKGKSGSNTKITLRRTLDDYDTSAAGSGGSGTSGAAAPETKTPAQPAGPTYLYGGLPE